MSFDSLRPCLGALLAAGLTLAGCSSTSESNPEPSSAGTGGAAGIDAGGARNAMAGSGGASALGGATGLGGGSAGLPSTSSGASSGGASGGQTSSVAGADNGGRSGDGGRPPSSAGGTSAGATNSSGSAGRGGASSAGGASGSGPGGSGGQPNVTVWLAGDSTVANGNTPCPTGWGARFKEYFDDRVTVTNSAVGGRSVRTWLYNVQTTMDSSGECNLERDQNGMPVIQARWQAMLTGMKAGDYLFIQFGINDGSATCDRHVGLAAFKESYQMMARAAKERGAQPIFVTPVSAIACNGNTPRATRGGYVTATQEAGMAADVPVIDLHALSIALYDELDFCPIPGGDVSASTTGPVGDFFCDDHTHFSRSGAAEIAKLVANALRAQNIGLAAYLK